MANIRYKVEVPGTSTAYRGGTDYSKTGGLYRVTADDIVFDPQIHEVKSVYAHIEGITYSGGYAGFILQCKNGEANETVMWIDGITSGIRDYRSDGSYVQINDNLLRNLTQKNQGTSAWFLCVTNDTGSITKNQGGEFFIEYDVGDKYRRTSATTQNAMFADDSPGAVNTPNVVLLRNDNIDVLHHRVTWRVGSHEHHVDVAAGVTSAEFQIPKEWMDVCPESTSTTMTITVDTYYNGKTIGTQFMSQRMVSVPTTVVPSYDGIYCTMIDNTATGYPTQNGMYIQNLTGVYIAIKNPEAGYASTLTKYGTQYYVETELKHNGITVASSNMQDKLELVKITAPPIPNKDKEDCDDYQKWYKLVAGIDDDTVAASWWDANATYVVYKLPRLSGSGDIVLSVSIKDDRRRVCETWRNNEHSQPVSVIPYAQPTISLATASRCDERGVASADGTYAFIRAVASVTEFRIANDYDSSRTYVVGDYTYHNNITWRCIQDINVAEEFNDAHWAEITKNKMQISAWYYKGSPAEFNTVQYNESNNMIKALYGIKIEVKDGTTTITPGEPLTAHNNTADRRFDMENSKTYRFGAKTQDEDDYLSPNETYTVVFVVSDGNGGQSTAVAQIKATSYALHIHRGGDGVAVGTISKDSGVFEIEKTWGMKFRNHLVNPVVFSATDAPPDPWPGLIWVKLKN